MEYLLLEQDRQGKIQISKIGGGKKQLFLNANLRLAIDQTIYFFYENLLPSVVPSNPLTQRRFLLTDYQFPF